MTEILTYSKHFVFSSLFFGGGGGGGGGEGGMIRQSFPPQVRYCLRGEGGSIGQIRPIPNKR